MWWELMIYTGVCLLPLGAWALAMLCRDKPHAGNGKIDGMAVGWRNAPGLWALWVLISAVAFTWVDWHQTKHLEPMLLAFYLAIGCWAARGRRPLWIVSVVLPAVAILGVMMIGAMARDFSSLPIVPGW